MEKIESNWTTFEKLCKRLSDENLNELLDVIGERIAICPSSSRQSQPGAYPGFNLSLASILKVGLLHDIGKVGDLENEYFIEQDSDWHIEKLGQVYKFNDKIDKMSISHRSIYILQRFGVTLSKDEWLAIQLAQGSHFEENRFYVDNEPTLAILLQISKKVSKHNN
jgi:hypothetical protein